MTMLFVSLKKNRHPNAMNMRPRSLSVLAEYQSGREGSAAEKGEQDYIEAVNLYLKGGMPGKAAQVLFDNDIMQPQQLIETVATALTGSGNS